MITQSVYGRLTSVSGGASASISYDGLGRLWATTGSAATLFLYDGDRIAAEYDGGGNVLRRYVPGAGPLETALWVEGGSVRWYLQDRRGSVMAAVDGAQNLSAQNTYDESGVPGSSNVGRLQLNGLPWIPEAGLYKFGQRYYSPTLGRFLQPDPSGYADSLNLYQFAHDDSPNLWDPTGLEAQTGSILSGVSTGASCSGNCGGGSGHFRDDGYQRNLPAGYGYDNHGQPNQAGASARVYTFVPDQFAVSSAYGFSIASLGSPVQTSATTIARTPRPQPQSPSKLCSASAGVIAGAATNLGVEAGVALAAGAKGSGIGGRIGAIFGEAVEPVGGGDTRSNWRRYRRICSWRYGCRGHVHTGPNEQGYRI